MRDKLQTLLARLRFDGMAAALDAELERAEREATPAPELLYRLISAEDASQPVAWGPRTGYSRGRRTGRVPTDRRAWLAVQRRARAWRRRPGTLVETVGQPAAKWAFAMIVV